MLVGCIAVLQYCLIVYILYEDGLYDFHICGYLLSASSGRKLVQVDCRAATGVTVEALKRGGVR